MKRLIPTPLFVLACSFVLAFGQQSAEAQTGGQPTLAEVTNVRQAQYRGWFEFEVEVNVTPATASARFVDRVKVEASIGFDGPQVDGQRTFVLYRAEAEAVTIERGRAFFRFYLPPEVVRRDTLREAPYFSVAVTAGGQVQPPSRASFSSRTLSTPEVLQSFQSRVSSEAGVNDGIFLPQYLTPAAFDSSKAAPSFVRRDGR